MQVVVGQNSACRSDGQGQTPFDTVMPHLVQPIFRCEYRGIHDDSHADLPGPAVLHERPRERIALYFIMLKESLRGDGVSRLTKEADGIDEKEGLVKEWMACFWVTDQRPPVELLSHLDIKATPDLQLIEPCCILLENG